jgi:hypothetical protein
MNDLSTWLANQHHGLRTFRAFEQKLHEIGSGDPGQRAICRLLSAVVGNHVDAYDEAPLPVAVADRAHRHLLELVSSIDFSAGTERRLADINRVAAWSRLRPPCGGSLHSAHGRAEPVQRVALVQCAVIAASAAHGATLSANGHQVFHRHS